MNEGTAASSSHRNAVRANPFQGTIYESTSYTAPRHVNADDFGIQRLVEWVCVTPICSDRAAWRPLTGGWRREESYDMPECMRWISLDYGTGTHVVCDSMPSLSSRP